MAAYVALDKHARSAQASASPQKPVLAFEVEDPRSAANSEVARLLAQNGTTNGHSHHSGGPHQNGAVNGHAHGHANGHGHLHGHGGGDKCGVGKTLANIFIAFVGAGILGLPYAFMRAGLALGAAFMLLLSALAFYGINLLVDCKRSLDAKGVVTYSEVALHALGHGGKTLVEVLLLLSQTGFCVAYLIFIGANVTPLIPLSKVAVVLLLLPLQVMLAMFRDLSALAPFSLLADAAHIVGMVVVLKDDVDHFRAHETVVLSKGVPALPFLFGVVIYCYEGIGMILPIEDAMRDRSKFKLTLSLGFSIITSVFLLFGVVGYAAYGEHTADIITANLPDDWSTTSVKIALCCALFFTFPIMMIPVYEIMERALEGATWFERSVSPNKRWAVMRVMRTGVVSLVALAAISIPHFGMFISFIGSFCCASLAFILPSLCHLILFNGSLSWWRTALNYGLLVFGFVGMIFGVAESVGGMLAGEVRAA